MTDMTPDYLDAHIDELSEKFLTEDRIKRFDDVLAKRLGCMTAVFEDFYDEHNANACIRSCEVFGCPTLHVVSVNNSFHANHGTSKSATRWVEVKRHPSTAECFDVLKSEGYTMAGTFPPGPGVAPFTATDLPDKLCIAMGCEATGLTDEARNGCDLKVTIPQYGFTQSLNVSVSLAIVMEHYARRYRESGRQVGLPVSEQVRIARMWKRRDLYRKFGWAPPQTN